MPSAVREEISSGGCRVIVVLLTSTFAELPGGRGPSGCRRPLHYTMIRMKDKPIGVVHKHRWDVAPAEARKIQEQLRTHWIGEDAFGEIRTVAGVCDSFFPPRVQAVEEPREPLESLHELQLATH